jgi:3-hydroxymyristoyl/3-hydroxydecanoyl-(acyl carrier protein) dehydratase
MIQTLSVPADSPFFAGHFPGHPILPGIAHLAFVAQALGGSPIAEIPSLRLRSPVRPGDVLFMKIDGPTDEGTVRFELRREAEVASSGSLRVGPAGALPELPEIPETFGPHPPVEALLPHVPPARLVRSVLEISSEGLTGVASIPEASPFAADGRVPAFVGLEAAAQGAAVLEALERREAPGPRIGYLVGLRGVRLAVAALPVERPFRFAVRLTGSAPPLSIYEVTVEGPGGAELLRGAISTFILPES